MMGVEAGQGVFSVVFDWSSVVSKSFLFCKATPVAREEQVFHGAVLVCATQTRMY